MNNNDLVEKVRTSRIMTEQVSPSDERIFEAMSRVDRAHFVTLPEGTDIRFAAMMMYGEDISELSFAEQVYVDIPLPIGEDQTCSQPRVVAYLAKLLGLEDGMRVLEVGTGCGYQAAVLGELVSPNGMVVSVESRWSLCCLAQENLSRHFKEGYGKVVKAFFGDGSAGWESECPYDRILFTAGVHIPPQGKFSSALLANQVPHGILVYPQHIGSIIQEHYQQGTMVDRKEFQYAMFVDLQGKNS